MNHQFANEVDSKEIDSDRKMETSSAVSCKYRIWVGWFETGTVIAGWFTCNGAGLFECEKSTHAARKLNNDAMVIHSRIPFFKNFHFITFHDMVRLHDNEFN